MSGSSSAHRSLPIRCWTNEIVSKSYRFTTTGMRLAGNVERALIAQTYQPRGKQPGRQFT